MLTRLCILILLYSYPLTVQAQLPPLTHDSWRTWMTLSADYALRHDARYCWYQYGSPTAGDTLVYQAIHHSFYRTFPQGFNAAFSANYFLCQLPGDTLVIADGDSIQYLPNVQSYQAHFDQLVLQQSDTLFWKDLRHNTTKTVWHGTVQAIAFDGTQLAFVENGHLRHYQPLTDSTTLLLYNCAGGLQFLKDGKHLLYQLPRPQATATAKLRIWHYQDYYLQKPPPMPVTMVMILATKRVYPVTTDSTQIAWQQGGRYIVTQNILHHQEYYWNKQRTATLYLFDTHTGTQRQVVSNADKLLLQPAVSPGEQFMTWYDPSDGYIYSYEIGTGRSRRLMKSIGIAQWAAGDSTVFMHTQREVWAIDPRGKRPAEHLTRGQSRRLTFRMLTPDVLTAFDNKTKANGYWRIRQHTLVNCGMTDALYYMPVYPLDHYKPVKAKDIAAWLITRMRADGSPVLLFTTDFISFLPLREVYPEKKYNWLRVTLTKHGLLYTPQDFYPQQKYPVIFHYYEGSKDQLHRYVPPALSEGGLNIPWYVSNGYVVFVPHIVTKATRTGKSAARAVIRAARYVSRFSWADKKRMGLQGHSFGGYVTNYVITHTRRFAAAQASAGPVNFISGYGAVRKLTGTAMQPLYEQGQNKMATPPWKRPQRYLNNSPVMRSDKVYTPLLMLHNDNDNAVPFAQGIEFFTALRRLQRPVWLLQYAGEGHQLYRNEDKHDFSVRQQQFFDHYLKGQPMPDWMKGH
ncbi:S9 family peptidase [Chitinophaga rhizophila]|uniref:Prolyl oligopeptidase family serine peptidase n=1 Tax=Chitinophaga rhizophila TaxID=2866212 RepID=A0ABS7GL73_9BACT|nr:prolyl oligopeptidase family serine peptidase [Chitinophaga rhizophila]MBW8688176.1 prolyl oligopeptidase family serine peptidase [Chitinophaga rhizophila]